MMRVQVEETTTPLDIIGDVHGCFNELMSLVELLGYDRQGIHPDGRKLVFLGDLCDRGPFNADVFDWVYTRWKRGDLYWCMGNHDNKLFRWMKGNPVQVDVHGYGITARQMSVRYKDLDERERIGKALLETLPHKIEFRAHNLVCVHAYPGDTPEECYYGLRNAKRQRLSWWENWEGGEDGVFVAFGHYWMNDPTPYPRHVCLDTSCCRGGTLTAMRWPEQEIHEVKAFGYYDPDYPVP